MSTDNKIAIVTGGTRGIGLATSKKLADQGYIVYACARNHVNFHETNIRYLYMDVTNVEACNVAFNTVINRHGKLDVLVADAGITRDALTVKMTEDKFDEVIDVNIKGVFNIVKLVGPFMEKQGYGSIVTISSIVGQYGNIGQANYAASKGAVISMTKSWAKEFSRKGSQVRVNAVAPGYTMTDMMSTVPDKLLEVFKGQTMLGRLARPEEIANTIAFLSSDEASYITGMVLDVNGGMRL